MHSLNYSAICPKALKVESSNLTVAPSSQKLLNLSSKLATCKKHGFLWGGATKCIVGERRGTSDRDGMWHSCFREYGRMDRWRLHHPRRFLTIIYCCVILMR